VACDAQSVDIRVREKDLIVRQVGPETVVYDRGRHRAHCLRPLAAAVWRECDGRRSTAEIAERVSAARGESIDEAAVLVALRRFERAGLIERGAPRSGRADPGAYGASPGAGRRGVLRRVAALAGLAVVSVIAPTPEAAAATCLPNGQTCASSAECCSGCCQEARLRCKPGQGGCLPGTGARRR
jgi:hypothetical protein